MGEDDAAFAAYSAQLADQIEVSLVPWVLRSVRSRVEAVG